MLDPRYYGEDIKELENALLKRGKGRELLSALSMFASERKRLTQETEGLKARRNSESQEIGKLKANIQVDPEAKHLVDAKMKATRELGDQIKELDVKLKEAEVQFSDLALGIPNIPYESVPAGKDASHNVQVRSWGNPTRFSFNPKDHVDIGTRLGILDFERASKLSGARFSIYLDAGAALERALIQFMLDVHTRDGGYREVIPPYLVSRQTMIGTGQLPKFEEDLFKTQVGDRELFLIPTSEVPLTNLYSGEILEKASLPICLTAYSPCFRSEAGSYGKDTRGLVRLHQFQKVELVKLVEPHRSFDELESLTHDAEKIIQKLELPYRTMCLCAGDMGFSAAKTYDLEVWLPAQNEYREISSASNCTDFQARRAQIRYRPESQGKTQFVHTLNASGLAVGRTFVAILENFQDEKGDVRIPTVLNKYLDGAPGFKNRGGVLWIAKN